MNRMHIFIAKRPGSLRVALMLAFMVAVGFSGAFAAETGTNLPWEGPLTTLVTSLTGPVAYAISVIAIVALGATLAFRGGEMGETMRHLLQAGIAVCLVVFFLYETRINGARVERTLRFSTTIVDSEGRKRSNGMNDIEHGEIWRLRARPWRDARPGRSPGLP